MSYNKTYSEIKQILKDSKRITKVTMLKVAKLAIIETLGETRALETEVTWDSSLADDLNLDSLDMVELVMFLEECFGVEISDDMAMDIVTVGDAIEKIKEAKANKGKKRKVNPSKYKKPAAGSPYMKNPPGKYIGSQNTTTAEELDKAIEDENS
tara:strand:- start:977 stop:1438 length:462 start_codon:yes stop_codon:yes gene_type:complete